MLQQERLLYPTQVKLFLKNNEYKIAANKLSETYIQKLAKNHYILNPTKFNLADSVLC